jgi:hypothetical protein
MYRAQPQSLATVMEWTSRHRDFWQQSLNRLGQHLDGQ